jgi:hypothetical protein
LKTKGSLLSLRFHQKCPFQKGKGMDLVEWHLKKPNSPREVIVNQDS